MASWRAGLLAAALALDPAARAAEPVLKHLFPVGGQRGTTVQLTAKGTFDTWPPQVWTDGPGLTFTPAAEKGKLSVEIAKDAALGPHLVRLCTPGGASAPRFFIVSDDPESLEVEPNDSFKEPQKIEKLPVGISGRLDKSGDVDSFSVTLQAGQSLTAAVDGYTLGSPFDGMLRIVDERGVQQAFNEDGRTLDPLLSWTAPRDGTFTLQLMGFTNPPSSTVSFTGNENCLYHLRLTHGAAPLAPLPPGDLPEQAEKEPNDTNELAGMLPMPGSVTGTIDKPGDEDRFAFTAVRLRDYDLRVLADRAGSPLDPWLKIEGPDGHQWAKMDDQGNEHDPQFIWKAPADGTFYAIIGDTTHRGGPGYFYRLSVREAKPMVTATTTTHALLITPDKGAELKVTVKRLTGHQAKLQLAALELPEGISAPPVDVPDKDGDVVLKFTREATAPAASQPLRVVLREVEGGASTPVRYLITAGEAKDGAPPGPSDLLIDSTEVLWLTVPPPAEPATAAEPKPEPPQ